MPKNSRRIFLMQLAASGAGALSARAFAEGEPVRLTEDDPYAHSFGFRLDTANVDQAKFPRHDVSQHCSRCQLYKGKPEGPVGPCSFYGGRLVPINGWCRNFKLRNDAAPA
jgi:hypothetical protein